MIRIYHVDGSPEEVCLVYWKDKETRITMRRRIPTATNNVAEYKAILDALMLEAALFDKAIDVVHIYSDSQLVISQIQGKQRATKQHIAEKLEAVNGWLTVLNSRGIKVVFNWIPRSHNLAGVELERKSVG